MIPLDTVFLTAHLHLHLIGEKNWQGSLERPLLANDWFFCEVSRYFQAAHSNGKNTGLKLSFRVETPEHFMRHKSSNEWPTALKSGVG